MDLGGFPVILADTAGVCDYMFESPCYVAYPSPIVALFYPYALALNLCSIPLFDSASGGPQQHKKTHAQVFGRRQMKWRRKACGEPT
jgi:hypothetical protein